MAAGYNLLAQAPVRSRTLALQITSIGFALLQSACTLFMALSGLRLLLGVGAVASAGLAQSVAIAIHGPALRLPMLVFALSVSLLNLAALRRIRALRNRASSQWRIKPADAQSMRSERLQLTLSVLSIVLVITESAFHFHLHGTL